jgi:hypothetical protein
MNKFEQMAEDHDIDVAATRRVMKRQKYGAGIGVRLWLNAFGSFTHYEVDMYPDSRRWEKHIKEKYP